MPAEVQWCGGAEGSGAATTWHIIRAHALELLALDMQIPAAWSWPFLLVGFLIRPGRSALGSGLQHSNDFCNHNLLGGINHNGLLTPRQLLQFYQRCALFKERGTRNRTSIRIGIFEINKLGSVPCLCKLFLFWGSNIQTIGAGSCVCFLLLVAGTRVSNASKAPTALPGRVIRST